MNFATSGNLQGAIFQNFLLHVKPRPAPAVRNDIIHCGSLFRGSFYISQFFNLQWKIMREKNIPKHRLVSLKNRLVVGYPPTRPVIESQIAKVTKSWRGISTFTLFTVKLWGICRPERFLSEAAGTGLTDSHITAFFDNRR
jgi:hypothetical protein